MPDDIERRTYGPQRVENVPLPSLPELESKSVGWITTYHHPCISNKMDCPLVKPSPLTVILVCQLNIMSQATPRPPTLYFHKTITLLLFHLFFSPLGSFYHSTLSFSFSSKMHVYSIITSLIWLPPWHLISWITCEVPYYVMSSVCIFV